MQHVFISYVREDQETVASLAGELMAHGVDVWLDRTSIRAGTFWKDAIQTAIQEGAFFVACFSEFYLGRDKSYMNEEIALAIEELRQYKPSRAWFIPVLLSNCTPPPYRIGPGTTLRDLQWVPLHEDWDGGVKAILDVIHPLSIHVQANLDAMRSENDRIRYEAVNSVAGINHPQVMEALVDRFEDPSHKIRAAAANSLHPHGAKVSSNALFHLLNDPHFMVRVAAVNAIQTAQIEGSSARIAECLRDQSGQVKKAAARALLTSNCLEMIPIWIKAIDDPCISKVAEEALCQLGPEIVSHLKQAVDTKGWRGQHVIYHVLRRIESDEARSVIEAKLKNEDEWWQGVLRLTEKKK